MARKKKQAPAGAPQWMVTYGDMMTLLLCFFVIIVSMSEIKKDERFQEVIESIRSAFAIDPEHFGCTKHHLPRASQTGNAG